MNKVLARGQVVAAGSYEVNQVALSLESQGGHVLDVVHQTNHGNGRGREDRLYAVAHSGLVVKTNVPASDGGLELQTGLAHALNSAHKLPVNLWIVGISKIEAVGDCAGASAGANNVAGALGHGNHSAHFGVCVHVAAVAVHRHG